MEPKPTIVQASFEIEGGAGGVQQSWSADPTSFMVLSEAAFEGYAIAASKAPKIPSGTIRMTEKGIVQLS